MAEIKKYLDLAVGLPKLVEEIKAADAKVAEDAKAYAEGLGVNYDAAGAAATAEANAKAHAETKVQELADGQVKTNTDAIAKLNGAVTEEGSVAKAIADAKALIDADIDGVEAAVATKAEAQALADEVQARKDADADLDERLQVVEGAVGETGSVADAIAAAQEAAEKHADDLNTAMDERVAELEAIDHDAYVAADTALEEKLQAAIDLKADQTALNAVSDVANAAVKQADYDVKIKALEDEDARIAGLVEAEATKAREEEGKLDARLVEVETFFKTAEGETLDTALDTLVEIQKYLDGEGEVADQMLLDIAANKKAIEDHVATDHDFATADATLKEELMGEINKKADATVVEGIDGRVEVVEGKVSTLEGEMDAAEGRLDAIETMLGDGEGSVADQISDAKQAAIDAAAADATEKANQAKADAIAKAEELDLAMDARMDVVEGKAHEHANKDVIDGITSDKVTAWDDAASKAHVHANATVLDGITAEKVAAWDASEKNAKDHADSLNTAMTTRVDGVEDKVDANAEAIATKAAQADLTAAVERITTVEGVAADNKARLDSFVAISAEEITALFS